MSIDLTINWPIPSLNFVFLSSILEVSPSVTLKVSILALSIYPFGALVSIYEYSPFFRFRFPLVSTIFVTSYEFAGVTDFESALPSAFVLKENAFLPAVKNVISASATLSPTEDVLVKSTVPFASTEPNDIGIAIAKADTIPNNFLLYFILFPPITYSFL